MSNRNVVFFFQQLVSDKCSWILYDDSFKQYLGEWSDKCKNKIIDYNEAINQIKESDYIIFQNIDDNKSSYCNTSILNELKKR